jgi:hypothetical protein
MSYNVNVIGSVYRTALCYLLTSMCPPPRPHRTRSRTPSRPRTSSLRGFAWRPARTHLRQHFRRVSESTGNAILNTWHTDWCRYSFMVCAVQSELSPSVSRTCYPVTLLRPHGWIYREHHHKHMSHWLMGHSYIVCVQYWVSCHLPCPEHVIQPLYPTATRPSANSTSYTLPEVIRRIVWLLGIF